MEEDELIEKGELIGQVTMRHKKTLKYSRVVVHFVAGARELFKEIIITFSPITLKIGFPTLDSKLTYSVKGSQFNFSYNSKIPNEEFIGKYNLFKISEDEYQLEKIEV